MTDFKFVSNRTDHVDKIQSCRQCALWDRNSGVAHDCVMPLRHNDLALTDDNRGYCTNGYFKANTRRAIVFITTIRLGVPTDG